MKKFLWIDFVAGIFLTFIAHGTAVYLDYLWEKAERPELFYPDNVFYLWIIIPVIAGIIVGKLTWHGFKKSFIYINIGIFTAIVILLFFMSENFVRGIYENLYPDKEREIISQDIKSGYIGSSLILLGNSSVVFLVFIIFLAIKKLFYKFKTKGF